MLKVCPVHIFDIIGVFTISMWLRVDLHLVYDTTSILIWLRFDLFKVCFLHLFTYNMVQGCPMLDNTTTYDVAKDCLTKSLKCIY